MFVDIHHNAEDEDDDTDDSAEVAVTKANHIDCGLRLLSEGTVVVAERQQPCADSGAEADTDQDTADDEEDRADDHQFPFTEPGDEGRHDEVDDNSGDGGSHRGIGQDCDIAQDDVAEVEGHRTGCNDTDIEEAEDQCLDKEVSVFKKSGERDLKGNLFDLNDAAFTVLIDMFLASDEADQHHHKADDTVDQGEPEPADVREHICGNGIDDQGSQLRHNKAQGGGRSAVLDVEGHTGEEGVIRKVIGRIDDVWPYPSGYWFYRRLHPSGYR